MDSKVVVIGAGAIGLSIARKIAGSGHSVILLEKEAKYGCGVSSRNTEVIHAGIYYQTPLKAGLCVRGKELLYKYCEKHQIKHKRIGKIIVAVSQQETSKLELMKKQALSNGVRDLVELGRNDITRLEPEITGSAGLFSPSSGIFDSHGFMETLFREGRENDVTFAALSPVVGAEPLKDGWKVMVGGKEPTAVTCRLVINSTGLYSVGLSRKVFPGRKIPKLYPVKGSYARYSGKSPVRHIIYPALVPGVLNKRVDATPDLGGSLRFGPTSEESAGLEDFSIVPGLLDDITPAIKRYLPSLEASRCHPDSAGIRPKIFGPGDPAQDFCFEWAPEPAWLDLWGIESPGLTASLAIAEHVYGLAEGSSVL